MALIAARTFELLTVNAQAQYRTHSACRPRSVHLMATITALVEVLAF